MVQRGHVGETFRALSDPTRLAIVDRLVTGPSTVTELAAPFPMTLTAIVQHVQVLEAAGVVVSHKVGRVRTCRLRAGGLDDVAQWVDEHRVEWERRFDRLGALLADHPPSEGSD